MRKELEDAAREGASRRSNSPVPALAELERTGSLSDLTGNAKAAGFFSDGIPKRIHLKFVSSVHPITKMLIIHFDGCFQIKYFLFTCVIGCT